MLGGVLGSIITVWVTFVPCFLWIFVGAPYVEALRNNKSLNTAMTGITAAVMGVVLNLAVWFAIHTIFGSTHDLHALGAHIIVPDWGSISIPTTIIAALAMLMLFRLRLGMMKTIGICALLGLAHTGYISLLRG
jgi:chromate transporter